MKSLVLTALAACAAVASAEPTTPKYTINQYDNAPPILTYFGQNPYLGLPLPPSSVIKGDDQMDLTVPPAIETYVWELTGYFKAEKDAKYTMSIGDTKKATLQLGLRDSSSQDFKDMITEKTDILSASPVTLDLRKGVYPIRIVYIAGIEKVPVYVTTDGTKKELNDQIQQLVFDPPAGAKTVVVSTSDKGAENGNELTNGPNAQKDKSNDELLIPDTQGDSVALLTKNAGGQPKEILADTLGKNLGGPLEDQKNGDASKVGPQLKDFDTVKENGAAGVVSTNREEPKTDPPVPERGDQDGHLEGTNKPSTSTGKNVEVDPNLAEPLTQNGVAKLGQNQEQKLGENTEEAAGNDIEKNTDKVEVEKAKRAAEGTSETTKEEVDKVEKNKEITEKVPETNKQNPEEVSEKDQQKTNKVVARYYENGFFYSLYLAQPGQDFDALLQNPSSLLLLKNGYFNKEYKGIAPTLAQAPRIIEIIGHIKVPTTGNYKVTMAPEYTAALQIGPGSEQKKTEYTVDGTWQLLDTRLGATREFELATNLYYPFRIVVLGSSETFVWQFKSFGPSGEEMDLFGIWADPVEQETEKKVPGKNETSPTSPEPPKTPNSPENPQATTKGSALANSKGVSENAIEKAGTKDANDVPEKVPENARSGATRGPASAALSRFNASGAISQMGPGGAIDGSISAQASVDGNFDGNMYLRLSANIQFSGCAPGVACVSSVSPHLVHTDRVLPVEKPKAIAGSPREGYSADVANVAGGSRPGSLASASVGASVGASAQAGAKVEGALRAESTLNSEVNEGREAPGNKGTKADQKGGSEPSKDGHMTAQAKAASQAGSKADKSRPADKGPDSDTPSRFNTKAAGPDQDRASSKKAADNTTAPGMAKVVSYDGAGSKATAGASLLSTLLVALLF